MKFTMPVYVEQAKTSSGTEFRVRPLFFEKPQRRAELLSRAMTRIAQDLRSKLEKAGREPQHSELLDWSFAPDIETELFDETLLLRHRTIRCQCMLASFESLGRIIAFSPTLPEVWFDVAKGETVRNRALEVFTDYFRELEKDKHDFLPPAEIETFERGSVTELDIDLTPTQKCESNRSSPLAAIMGDKKVSGAEELRSVGRRLEDLYPEDLDRAILRDIEVAELTRIIQSPDRRPVLLVGPRMSGKSTIIHEYVFRRLEAQSNPHTDRANVWLLAPQRIISGMSYVGQWENRLLAILAEAKKKDHILYFDDLPGLYHAGLSASSNLSVAHVLRPYVERRDVRVLAEITPEALRVVQERDRGFLDQFHVIPVRAPALAQARHLLISTIRHLEGLQRCEFAIDVLPTVLELQERYVRDLSLPGKAALFLKDLAAKYQRQTITRQQVIQEFQLKSGMSVAFLDRHQTLGAQDVTKALEEHLSGQAQAVRAMADVVATAKAQLNDPTRPFGSFLFLGPTGVGKTQAAKALAHYLYGDSERLLRFDMNEFVDPYSVLRLVGTWDRPEGVLTSAVRRQPYSVVLLDEIEKAHPAVFDLLLQVLGEGRLTDSVGRTSDFGNTIIIMTSNLGVREAQSQFGFALGNSGAAGAYRRASESFFRPEFFNRIDRIVPFDSLSREQTGEIARRIIADVLGREGLQQRRCMLSISNEAMERIIDQGYQPEYGARALRRVIDRQIVQPVAARLAAIEPGTPTLLRVYAGGAAVAVQVRPMAYAQQRPAMDFSNSNQILDRVDAALDRLHEQMESLRPQSRAVVGQITSAQAKYFAVREQFDKVERLLGRLDSAESSAHAHRRAIHPRAKISGLRRSRVHYRSLMAATDLHQYLADVVAEIPETFSDDTARTERLVRELSYLDAMLRTVPGERMILLLSSLAAIDGGALSSVLEFYTQAGAAVKYLPLGLQHAIPDHFVKGWIEFAAGATIFPAEAGIHLALGHQQQLVPFQIRAKAIKDGHDAQSAALEGLDDWKNEIAGNEPGLDTDTILRIYSDNIVDLRTGLVSPVNASPGACMDMLLAQLPLPTELEN